MADTNNTFSAPEIENMLILSGQELTLAQIPAVKKGGLSPEAVRELLTRAAHTIDALYTRGMQDSQERLQVIDELDEARARIKELESVLSTRPEQLDDAQLRNAAISQGARILSAADEAAAKILEEANAEAGRIQAGLAAERARLARETEAEQVAAEQRRSEIAAGLKAAEIAAEAKHIAIDTQLEEDRAAADAVRADLVAQLEAFRTHSATARDEAIAELERLITTVRGFEPVPDFDAQDMLHASTELPAATATEPLTFGAVPEPEAELVTAAIVTDELDASELEAGVIDVVEMPEVIEVIEVIEVVEDPYAAMSDDDLIAEIRSFQSTHDASGDLAEIPAAEPMAWSQDPEWTVTQDDAEADVDPDYLASLQDAVDRARTDGLFDDLDAATDEDADDEGADDEGASPDPEGFSSDFWLRNNRTDD